MSATNLPVPATVARPDAAIVTTGQVPNEVYTILFSGGKVDTSAKGYQHIVASFEIISPDLAELPDGRKSSVAGKKGKMYMSIDPTSPQYSLWYEAFGRLELLDAEKNINTQEIINKLASKRLFAYCLLDSEERIQRKPKRPGQDVGDPVINPKTKKPLTGGWDFRFIQPEALIGIDPSGGQGEAAAAAATRPY